MRRAWSTMCLVAVLACGDDEGRDPDGSLVPGGNLDGGGTSNLDGGSPSLDGALGDAQVVSPTPPDTSTCSSIEQTLPVAEPAYHRAGKIVYADQPPVGGDHNGCWAKWTTYEQELEVERWVHNLEHGGVVFLYRCPDGCPTEVDQLTRFAKGRKQALLTPYAALPTRFAVVAWGVRITTDCFDLEAFTRFYAAHVNNGPEKVSSDPPSSCL